MTVNTHDSTQKENAARQIAGQRAMQKASANPEHTPYSLMMSHVNAAANVQAYPPLRTDIDEACLLQVS